MTIHLQPVHEKDIVHFQQELTTSFIKGLHQAFPHHDNPLEMAPIPPNDIKELYEQEGTVIYHLIHNGITIGGTVLDIREDTQHHEVIYLYINDATQGKRLGTQAWQAIEAAYPHTKVWTLYTPYFEKRNIHFYVNKCGFHIVAFMHRGNPEPDMPIDDTTRDTDLEFFHFQKVMR